MARLPVLRGNSCGKIPEHRRAASRPPQVRTRTGPCRNRANPPAQWAHRPRGAFWHAARPIWPTTSAVRAEGLGSRPRFGPPVSRHVGGETLNTALKRRRGFRLGTNRQALAPLQHEYRSDQQQNDHHRHAEHDKRGTHGAKAYAVCSSGSAPQQQNLGGGGPKAASREHPTASSVTADGNSEAPGKTADAWRLSSRTELTGITRARTRRHSVITAKQRCGSTIAVPPNWFGWRACRVGPRRAPRRTPYRRSQLPPMGGQPIHPLPAIRPTYKAGSRRHSYCRAGTIRFNT